MAYTTKEWADRVSEYPNRRRLEATETANTYDVVRDEGNIMVDGDAFDAQTMNNLESRISNAFDSIESSKGAANGIATLNASGKVVQNPASTGIANGIATLDSDGRLTAAQTAITTGNNANGTWIRFPDGTQICTKTVSVSMAINTAEGSLYYGTRTTLGDFAMPFTEAPAESVLQTTGPSALLDVTRDITASSAGSINLYKSTVTNQTVSYSIHVIAIGKWK